MKAILNDNSVGANYEREIAAAAREAAYLDAEKQLQDLGAADVDMEWLGGEYYPAPDELRDAYINDCDAGSGEGEE
jgi:hypothetical protein